ncbi:MAG TPA: sugar phosphate nucleotidyltransferase [Candidatus Saccharimonadia bacterium]|nr:sugar phosphate nucleotidyltransferase [Candidatus Saccharimonadia bacterium]
MTQTAQLEGIILAAGKGTRMHATEKNKVMYEVGGKPMISFPVAALKTLGVAKPIVVVGFLKETIQDYLGDSVQYAEQKEMLGTADAVRAAVPLFQLGSQDAIVLYGDHSTFYTAELLQGLIKHHRETGAAMTLITTHTNPTGYGRILRDASGKMTGIVEEKVATEEQKAITEINTGNAIYNIQFLKQYLPQIQLNPISHEYYFTDIVGLGVKNRENVETYVVEDELVGIGVNTPEQLAVAEQAMQAKGK